MGNEGTLPPFDSEKVATTFGLRLLQSSVGKPLVGILAIDGDTLMSVIVLNSERALKMADALRDMVTKVEGKDWSLVLLAIELEKGLGNTKGGSANGD